MKICEVIDLPVLLAETNSWAFCMPTGTVWNYELRTGGIPVRLELTADEGIFVSDDENAFLSCEHNSYGSLLDAEYELEIEAGRMTTNGWQYLAWLDADPATSGMQRRKTVSHAAPCQIEWDMKARQGQALSYGPDVITYGTVTNYPRALHAVEAGEYVPPPFVDIKARLFKKRGGTFELFSEDTKRIAIPQYVKIMWNNAALNEFRQPLVCNETEFGVTHASNVLMFAGGSIDEAESAFMEIPGKVKSMFPAEANIVVVGKNVDVPQMHKTVTIHSGRYHKEWNMEDTPDLGMTPLEDFHQLNCSPAGESGVYLTAIRKDINMQYAYCYSPGMSNITNDWSNIAIPLSVSNFTDIISQVALHECCHLMGLVPNGVNDGNGHNLCRCGLHIMDRGKECTIPIRLYASSLYLRWLLENSSYLKLVFHTPNEENNDE